jgi:2-polyprenyl-3-methyl-5-hydroxy-6-metoxy-1,4-benzoquinol methylase
MISTSCPFCFSKKVSGVLSAKDYTVSGESFEIWECADCTGRFTQNAPSESEIGKYYKAEDYISHSDTSKGVVNRLYHVVRNHTLRTKRKLVEKKTVIRHGKILDLGCGIGAFLQEMKSAGWSIEGIEPDEGARNKARHLYGIIANSPRHLYYLPEISFDAITLWHVLEHVHDLHNDLEQIKKLLKKTGRIFIAVPNYTSYDADFYSQYWAAYDVPRHLYHFSPASMQALMERHGMTVEEIKPMWFDSFYISMLSEKYKTGNSNMVSAVWRGVRSNSQALSNLRKCSSVIYVVKFR